MTGKQGQTLSEVSDYERALFEAQRIRKEIDGLIAFLAARVPSRSGRRGAAELKDPRTGKPFNKGR